MNKLKLFVGAMCLMFFFTACEKDVVEQPQNDNPTQQGGKEITEGEIISFTAGTEGANPTARTLLDGFNNIWVAGDKVRVFNKSNGYADYTAAPKDDAKYAVFTGIDVGTMSTAIYPSTLATTSPNQIKLPAVQQYAGHTSPANGAMPTYVKFVDGDNPNDVEFKNLCGMVHLQLTGNGEQVGLIRVLSTDKIAGTATITPDGSGIPSMTIADAGSSNIITLDCGAGVTLSSTPTDFYILVPPTESNTFTIHVETVDHVEITNHDRMVKVAPPNGANDNQIKRSIITKMPVLKYETLPYSYTFTPPVGSGNHFGEYTPITFKMILVEPGTFMMAKGTSVEHRVTLTEPYYMAEHEFPCGLVSMLFNATFASYYVDNNYTNEYPMNNITWTDSKTVCGQMTINESDIIASKGLKFDLPTEAQWEYAASGGWKSKGYTYAGGNTVGNVSWYSGNSTQYRCYYYRYFDNYDGEWYYDRECTTLKFMGHQETKTPNELRLYNMSGNVYEWVLDWYGDYPTGPVVNPTGPSSGTCKVTRGGSFNSAADMSEVTYRNGALAPSFDGANVGFRLVLIPTE